MDKKKKEKQTITFMIGNGFDLNCGLKTKYSDSYNQYLNIEPSSESISAFKKIMKDEITQGIDTWADFEMSIANHAAIMYQKGCLIDGLYDYTDFLGNYLSEQVGEFRKRVGRGLNLTSVHNMLTSFHSGMPSVTEYRLLSKIVEPYPANYRVLNFNYTDTIDMLLTLAESPHSLLGKVPIIHVHGTIQEGMILGVNDLEQLKISEQLTNREKRAVIKPFFNQVFDDTKIEQAKLAIQESDVICVYGLSLGDSDKMWRDLIVDWLNNSPNHHIVIFNHNLEHTIISSANKKMDLCEAAKEEVAMKLMGHSNDDITNQIHVPIGHKFFDMKELLNVNKLLGGTNDHYD